MASSERGPAGWQIALTLLGAAALIVLVFWGVVALIEATVPRAVEFDAKASKTASRPASEPLPVATYTPEVTPGPEPTPVESSPTLPPKPKPKPSGLVVTIDPGHQGTGDSSQEPIGPGSSQTKAKVAGGTRGESPESKVTLAVSLKLRDRLEAEGVKVVMVRTKQDVNISNSERAKVANKAGADLFVRLHCDGAEDSSRKGISTLVPGKNQWTGPIVSESRSAGNAVHKAVLAATGARDRGVVPRTDMTGFNWAKVPTVIVEMGFMTNSDEDAALNSSAYQDKLAKGLSKGIMDYLSSR